MGIVHPIVGQRPFISFLDKSSGHIGEIVTISGAGFAADPDDLSVFFGGAKASVSFASEFLIEAKIPAGATWGPIRVVNKASGLSGSSNTPFHISYSGDSFDVDFLQVQPPIPSFSGMYDLCACDFNLDGKVDIASSAQFANSLDFFVNTSSVEDIFFDKQPLATGFTTINLQCGDINNDGLPDLVVSRNAQPEVYIFLNDTPPGAKKLSWQNPTLLNVSGQNPRRVVLADLNQDGRPEVILTNDSNNLVSIFENQSTPGSFEMASTPVELTAGSGPRAGLSVADFNKDGYPEIVVSGFVVPDVFIFQNLSDPESIRFSEAHLIRLPGAHSNVLAVDIDQDESLDLAITDIQSENLIILRNASSDEAPIPSFEAPKFFDVGVIPWDLAAGDLNGDGVVDLSVARVDAAHKISLFINRSTPGEIRLESSSKSVTGKSRNLEIVDLNNDGKPDIVSTNQIGGSSLTVIRNENCLIPTLSPSETITICEGLAFDLKTIPSPGTTFRWDLNGTLIQSDTAPSIRIALEGDYLVTAISNGGQCANSSPSVAQLITTGSIPSPPSIATPSPICIGTDLTLQANDIAGAQYIWTGPQEFRDTLDRNTITIPDFQPQNAGRYFVEVFVDGCQSGTVSAVTQVINLPLIQIFNRRATPNLCEGDSTRLAVVKYPGYNYQWFKNDNPLRADTLTELDVLESGNYVSQIIDPSGCTFNSTGEQIAVFSPPSASFELIDATCAFENVKFESSSEVDSEAVVNYTWKFGNSDGDVGDSLVYQYPGAGRYIVGLHINYEGVENCTDFHTRPIEIVQAPKISLTNNNDTLGLCLQDSLTLEVSDNFETFKWSTGGTKKLEQFFEPGEYQVVATNLLGCNDTVAFEIAPLPQPDLIITSTPEGGIVRGDTAILKASGGLVYLWSPDLMLSDTLGDLVQAYPQTSTLYTIYTMSRHGCLDTTDYFLEVFPTREDPLPSAFSPNGDGIDDTWELANTLAFKNCKLTIINRNGSIVYSMANGYDNSWDGTYQGNPLPEGVYYYIFECPDGFSQKGALLLVR